MPRPARYRTAVAGPLSVSLAMVTSACRGPTEPLRNPELLTFAATAEGTSDLLIAVSATNETARDVYLEFGGCPPRVLAYAPGRAEGVPRWQGGPRCITQPLLAATIHPGETISPVQFSARVPVPEILGDSLPEGRYDIAAQLEFQRGTGAASTQDIVHLPAGSVLLSRAD